MPSAKQDFIDRIRSLDNSISIGSVSNSADRDHNNVAKLLRNGLAVVGFAALEDFIKTRSSEVMAAIGGGGVSFSDLPEKIQAASTHEAISALSYQLSVRDRSERISYIQEQARKISSTASVGYDLTEHSFAHNQANVNEAAIAGILKSFYVDDPWGNMSALSSRLNLTALPLIETYKGAMRRRHRAAHVASADTPQSDISQFVKEALAIAIGFDSLLTTALSKMLSGDRQFLRGRYRVSEADITFRRVVFESGKWKEFVEGRARAHRVSDDISAFKPQVQGRALAANQVYVEFDRSGLVADWECNCN